MPRLALVLDRFDPWHGGLEQWAWQLTRWLGRNGYEVHVVAFDFNPDVLDSGIIPHWLPRPSERLARASESEKLLRRLKVDLIHDLGVGWHCHILQPQAGCLRVNYRQALRSLSPWKRLLGRVSPSRFRRLREIRALESRQYITGRNIVVAVSGLVASHLRCLYRVDPGRMKIIHNGVDVRRFSTELRDRYRNRLRQEFGLKNEVLFLFAGHNFRLKGLITAIKALALLHRNHAPLHLAVIGREPAGEFKKIAERLGVGAGLTFCGAVRDPAPYFLAADALVHPTYYDACNLAVQEAWASGLPVITTRFNGASELMSPGRQGFIMDDPQDYRDLAGKMELLLEAPLRLTMSEEARALGSSRTLENNFREIEKLYRDII